MEEKYKIEKIEKLNMDINNIKHNGIGHIITSATYALFAVWMTVNSINLSTPRAYTVGWIFGALSIVELINGGVRKVQENKLKKARNELLSDDNLVDNEFSGRSK